MKTISMRFDCKHISSEVHHVFVLMSFNKIIYFDRRCSFFICILSHLVHISVFDVLHARIMRQIGSSYDNIRLLWMDCLWYLWWLIVVLHQRSSCHCTKQTFDHNMDECANQTEHILWSLCIELNRPSTEMNFFF